MNSKARALENALEIRPGDTEAAFNQAFNLRLRRLRAEAGMTQAAMAKALGVPLRTYHKYEYRSPLPPHLIPAFARIVGRDVGYVLTGDETP